MDRNRNMNTKERDQRARATSVRLVNLDDLEEVIRGFGFKDRTHFFQLCTDALLKVHDEGKRLEWPPQFVTRYVP